MKAVSGRQDKKREKKNAMKTMIKFSRNLSLGLTLVGLMTASAAFAQQKGAELLMQRKPDANVARTAASAPAMMKCPECKEGTRQVSELSFKGATHGQFKPVAVHQCPTCANKIAIRGHGKTKQDVVSHTCRMSGSPAGGCCATK